MSSLAAARSIIRTANSRTTIVSRVATGTKAKAAPSPFRIPQQNRTPLSRLTSRSPVEMSCCVETMLPYHTATASALLTSMLSVSRRAYDWTPEDCNDDV